MDAKGRNRSEHLNVWITETGLARLHRVRREADSTLSETVRACLAVAADHDDEVLGKLRKEF